MSIRGLELKFHTRQLTSARDCEARARLVPMSAEDDINIEDEVKAFLASDEMDRTADYCARGRPHKHLEQSAPLKAWITAFEAVADAVDARGSGYLAARQREGDLASEIKLREGRAAPCRG